MMRRHGTRTAVAGVAALLAAACPSAAPATPRDPEVTTMQLTSDAFEDGQPIPSEHTCDGADTSPPLRWSDVPDGTESFALIVDDPDARGFVHWVLTNVPANARELPEGVGDAIGSPGPNDFRRSGWGGPCPPSGEHRYVFTLYALASPISDASDADAVRSQAESAALGSARLTGVYSRR